MKLGLQLHILLETIRTFNELSKKNGMDEKEAYQVLLEAAEVKEFESKMKLFYSFKFMQQPINNILDQCGITKMGV